MPQPLPEFVTVAEIAALLKVNQQTVRNWLDAGILPYVRVGHGGRRVRVFKRDLDAFLTESASAPDPTPTESIWDGAIPPPR